jgi:acetyl-CoA carboxylase/biotin carboxylase 1
MALQHPATRPPPTALSWRSHRGPQAAPEDERAALAGLLEPLQEACRAHAGGKQGYARSLCTRLMEAFLAVEERFETGGRATEQEVIDSLRQVGGAAGPAGPPRLAGAFGWAAS